jgi:Electron transfer DM13
LISFKLAFTHPFPGAVSPTELQVLATSRPSQTLCGLENYFVTFTQQTTLIACERRASWALAETQNVKGDITMVRNFKTIGALVALALVFAFHPQAQAQSSTTQQQSAKILESGTFHGKLHGTSGRATIYQEQDGTLILRLTHFKTSNGPDVHVVLIAVKDAGDNANFLKSGTQRVELGLLKGNEGDQNYTIPAGTDLSKFQTVSIYCERFNANFGAAPLNKF